MCVQRQEDKEITLGSLHKFTVYVFSSMIYHCHTSVFICKENMIPTYCLKSFQIFMV